MKDMFKEHQFLSTYLDYVENTESPRLFHIWAALSGISAAMGRRVWYPNGISNVFSNQYVILSGPSGSRKSTAIWIMRDLLNRSTGVRFAPNDIGGQRQGLLKALIGNEDFDEDAAEVADILGLNGGNPMIGKLSTMSLDTRDPHSMYAVVSEFNSFIGERASALATFLVDMYDGTLYTYQLKKEMMKLEDGLLGIIAGTTPVQISIAMPNEAIGQGLTSRMIFVFGTEKHKLVPRPKRLPEDLAQKICETYSNVFHNFNGEMSETQEAGEFFDSIYGQYNSVNDPRFTHYNDRRSTHLIKLAMCLAACDGRMEIQLNDFQVGDEFLRMTEAGMPDALGEYGFDKSTAAKQKLLEFIRSSYEAIPLDMLVNLMAKDMSKLDCVKTVNEFIAAGSVGQIEVAGSGIHVIAKMQQVKRTKAEALKLM